MLCFTGRGENVNTTSLYSDPVWCEDCKKFVDVGPDGEGTCSIDQHSTWYGCLACNHIELKNEKINCTDE